ncbi:MAG TPA: hypothetical protein VHI13_16785 [Candidatus Kapabacteria bacterium]|nr:hypothetical protein [Candidatus Kapabacteria bacterium]
MPFLSYDQFEQRVGKTNAETLTKAAQSFESDQASAAALVTQITGVTPPDDPQASPDWAQQAVADIIYARRMPKVAGVKPEVVQACQALYKATRDELELYKTTAPTGSQDAQVGDMDGGIAW